jgi:superfamily I DNA/RNA helicase
VKGEEADAVMLCTDITGRVLASEKGLSDDERRVWYVGMTRARYGLIIASEPHKKNTSIIR